MLFKWSGYFFKKWYNVFKGILPVGLDPKPSLPFDVILAIYKVWLSSNHKGKIRETLTHVMNLRVSEL